MKDRAGLPVISIDELRVGLYVHLDLGWMSHPFALGHFKVATAEEVVRIRALGLKTLRCNPALSDPVPGSPCSPGEPAGAAVLPAPGCAAGSAVAIDAVPADTVRLARGGAIPARACEPDAAAHERTVQARCEQQFAVTLQALHGVHERVLKQPGQARCDVQALNQALLAEMLGPQDLCIRLLAEAVGDRAVAHALNVAILSLLLGRSFGWDESELADLGIGALLHDIGKLELPERLRDRADHFTAAEARFYEEHVARGVAQALRLGLSPGALLVIGQHHERADRSGYPMRIGSERMSAAARIVALVDHYDRLCNALPPQPALTPHEAVSLMFTQYQTRFDASILGAFIKMMGVYPPGSVVQLTDERLAMVVSVNSTRPLKPRVRVYQPGVASEDSLTLNLQETPGLGIRRSLKPQLLARDAMQVLAPRARAAYFFEPVPAGVRPKQVDAVPELLA